MKEIAFKGDGKRAIENEVKVMRSIKSEHVTKLHGVYETKNSVYLSMEYVDGVTLETYLKRSKKLSPENRKRILKALLVGLKDLKNSGIVHRDLKPENIIVSFNLETIKIIDFGLATNIDEPNYIFIRCGTPGFIAPEILQIKDPAQVRLGTDSDMFSLGAIFYRLLYGRSLFTGHDQAEVLFNNRLCKIKFSELTEAVYGEM